MTGAAINFALPSDALGFYEVGVLESHGVGRVQPKSRFKVSPGCVQVLV